MWVGFDSRVECAYWCTPVFELTGVGGPAGIALLSRARPITQIRTDEALDLLRVFSAH